MRFYSMMPDENIVADKIFKWIADVITVIVLGIFFVSFFCQQTKVTGNSMSSTLSGKDTVLIDSFNYKVFDPDRFDVISFHKTDKSGRETSYIKRIIALPGETIQIKDDSIYVNDKKIKGFKIKDKIVNLGTASQKITLEYNEYFVMGDNVNSSEDSRSVTIGNVKRNEIDGKVWFTIWPFNKIKTVK